MCGFTGKRVRKLLLQSISKKIASELKKIVPDKDEEVLQYGLQSLLSDFSSCAALITLSVIFGNTGETLIFLTAFIFLRRYTGGYHASTYLRCFLVTVLCYLTNVALAILLLKQSLYPVAIIITVVSLGLIFKFSPHENPRHPMTDREVKSYGRISRIGAAALLVAAAVLLILGAEKVALYGYMAVLTTSITLVVALVLDKGKKKKAYEEGGESDGNFE